MNTKFTYQRAGVVVLDMEYITLNSLIAQSQEGLDLKGDVAGLRAQEIWPSRLAEILKNRTGNEFSATEAYLIAVANSDKLKEAKESFTGGR